MSSEGLSGLNVWSSKGTSLETEAVSCPVFKRPTWPTQDCGVLGKGSLAVFWWNSASSSFMFSQVLCDQCPHFLYCGFVCLFKKKIYIYMFVCFNIYICLFLHSFIWLSQVLVAARRVFSSSMWDLVLWPGIEPRPCALGVQSLSHWPTREVLCHGSGPAHTCLPCLLL